jgi:hypothetical protein
MIAGAALMVSACGPKTETTTTNDTTITEMGNDVGTMSDNMTTVDSTSMDNGMMANDTAVVTNETSTTTTNVQ